MPDDRDLIDLWRETEQRLSQDSREHVTTALSAVNPADSGWLRQTAADMSLEAALAEALEHHGTYFHRVIIQGTRCTTVPMLLRTLGDALEFPSYYGATWDSLNECLLDLLTVPDGRLGSFFGERVGRRARSLVLTIDDADQLLNDEPADQLDTLLDVFRWIASRPEDPLGRDLPRGQLFVLLRNAPTSVASPQNTDR
ncbi:MAG: barstar family protein [Pseudonocardia sp.]